MASLVGSLSNIYLIGLNVWREIRCLNSSVGTSSILDIVGPLEQILNPSHPCGEWQLIRNDVRAYKFHRLVKLASLLAGSVLFPFLGVMMLIGLYFEDLPDTWNVGSEYRFRNLEKKEVWIEVNGVCTDRVFQESNGRHIASIFQREIKLFWNPTQGLLFDLIECMMGRTFNGLTLIAKKLELTLASELQRKEVEKVVLIAHSQGAIIASNAIAKLLHHKHQGIQKLEVYTFGSAAESFTETTFQGERAPYYEHYANLGDFVARIGVLHWMFTNYKHQNRYRYPGQLFVSKRRGHLLSEHYLSPLMRRAYSPSPCQDATEKEDFKKSKLYSYMDEVVNIF